MMSTTASEPATRANPIPIRRIEFRLDPATMPRDYYHDDAHLTLVLNALSTFFPDGERFFVDAVRMHKDRITDPALLADIAGFIGQEAMHAKEHEALNALVDAQGLPRSTKFGIDAAAFLLNVGRKLPPRFQLAATCGLEHFTAILAEQLLNRPNHADKLAGPARELWLWHALEEAEHKTVAYDVYLQSGGSRTFLGVTMIPVTALLIGASILTYTAMLAERGELLEPRKLGRTLAYLWSPSGLFTELVPKYFTYFQAGFHPSRQDDSAALARTRELLFGENGLLKEKLRQVRVPGIKAVGAA